ncbi:MAG TPA: hypothetical protein VNU97_13950 [Rhizomicrobium sp.]|nr:hypothetical protein [Rhizomicrobium sp.]
MSGRGSERGLALVSVLWGISILSLIAAAMLTASVTSAHLDRNAWNAARGGAVADAAVAKGVLALLDQRAAPRLDGTATSFALDGVAVRLRIQDESGRINLNYAPKELLQGLFVSAGLTDDDAGALAARIVKLREPRSADAPPTLAFRAVDELLALPGVSRALLDRVAPALTVYGRSGALNSAVAPREALRALPGMSEQAIDDLLRARDAAAQAAARSSLAGTPVAPGAAFRVSADLSVDGARTLRVAVVQFTGDAARPYLVLAWQ